MKIYGVAILAGCYLAGQLMGEYLGVILNIGGNVGGVGFGMLLLVFVHDRLNNRDPFIEVTNKGIYFWSAMYIPIVIAMAATQNVKAAVSGGWVAIIAGTAATVIAFALIPRIAKSFTVRTL